VSESSREEKLQSQYFAEFSAKSFRMEEENLNHPKEKE